MDLKLFSRGCPVTYAHRVCTDYRRILINFKEIAAHSKVKPANSFVFNFIFVEIQTQEVPEKQNKTSNPLKMFFTKPPL